MRALLAVAVADARDRLRRRRFVAVLALSVYLGFAVTAGDVELAFGQYRGEFTAAWLGSVMSIAGSTAILLFGFYVVTGSLTRDETTGVGQLVATTPVRSITYLFGKWCGNIAVLLAVVVTMGLSLVPLFLTRGVGPLDPVALLFPLVVVTLPTAALVAAVALLFDAIEPLRGSLGSVVYFCLAVVGMLVGAGLSMPALDLLGYSVFVPSMQTALAEQYPSYAGGGGTFGVVQTEGEIRQFTWTGLSWSLDLLVARSGLVALAGVVVAATTLPFDRFGDGGTTLPSLPLPDLFGDDDPASAGATESSASAAPTDDEATRRPGERVASVSLTPVESVGGVGVGRLLRAEARLALVGRPWWWYAGGLLLVAGGAVLPVTAVQSGVLAVAWIWPLFVWSDLGVRARRHGTDELLATSVAADAQPVAAWAVGALVAGLVGAGAAVTFAGAGDLTALVGLLAGAVFPPSLAFACGVWSGTARAFEITYLVVWYVGLVNGFGLLDFLGTRGGSPVVPLAFCLLGAVLFAVGYAGRRRRLD